MKYSHNYYHNIMVNSRLREFAEVVISKHLNPYYILIETAINQGLISEGEEPWHIPSWQKEAEEELARKRAAEFDAWDAYRKSQTKKEDPTPSYLHGDVTKLTDVLKNVIEELMAQHGVDEGRINALVTQAIRNAKNPSGMYGGSEFPAPGMKVSNLDKFKKLNTGDVWNTPGYEREELEKEPERPTWYDQMTNAEKKWYDGLSPALKKRFIGMHNARVGGSKDDPASGTTMGDLSIKPNTPDHDAVEKIAYYSQERRRKAGLPELPGPEALRQAAGLWNRHKIRQKMTHSRKNRNQEELPNDFDSLLSQDHNRRMGNVIKEWCLLAGIDENEKKKGK